MSCGAPNASHRTIAGAWVGFRGLDALEAVRPGNLWPATAHADKSSPPQVAAGHTALVGMHKGQSEEEASLQVHAWARASSAEEGLWKGHLQVEPSRILPSGLR